MDPDSVWVPILAVCLIVFAYIVNASGNKSVGFLSNVMAVVKVGGIMVFGIAAIWASGLSFAATSGETAQGGAGGFIASVALSILAFKGFTTITNSGAEITEPKRNVGRAIIWSIAICVMVYLLVAVAVGSSLTLSEISEAQDFSLAEAARPAFGDIGVWLTVALAIVATASGLIASVFAVSRMLAMLTDMKMIPHSHFGMPGKIKDHTLVYTVVIAGLLAVFFDLSRIASLGVFFYLVMDILIHWGVRKHMLDDIGARGWVMLTAIVLDLGVLAAFTIMKLQSDPWIVAIALIGIAVVFAFVHGYLKFSENDESEAQAQS